MRNNGLQDETAMREDDDLTPVKTSGLRRTPGLIIVATLQILGGVWGILMVAAVCPLFYAPLQVQRSVFAVDVVVPVPLLYLFNLGLWALFMSIFAANILAGILLLKRRRAGAWLTCILEVLQVPWINLPAFSYRLFVALALPVGLLFPKFLCRVGFKLGSGTQLWLRQSAGPVSVSVNLFALGLVFVALHWARSRSDTDRETDRSEPQDRSVEPGLEV